MSLLGWGDWGGRADARRCRTLCGTRWGVAFGDARWSRAFEWLDGAWRRRVLRFARGKGFVREVDHFVTTAVERRLVGLSRVVRVEREEKYPSFGAEALLLARSLDDL